MKPLIYILCVLFSLMGCSVFAQPQVFRENGKWGIKDQALVIIPARFDTVFNFDSTGKVCLACFRIKNVSPNKFIKVTTTSYACNYLNKKNQHLVIRNMQNDTCSVFALNKYSYKQYASNNFYFTAGTRSKKFLVDKDFRQITFRGYHDIQTCIEPKFYVAQMMNDAEVPVTGLLNEREEVLIPYDYSSLKINPHDSLIIACSAGLRLKTEDDIFNYQGKKLISSHRHVDLATKHFLVNRIFEAKEYYIVYNIQNHEEKIFHADEVNFYQGDNILIRVKRDWFIYNLVNGEKKPFKQN